MLYNGIYIIFAKVSTALTINYLTFNVVNRFTDTILQKPRYNKLWVELSWICCLTSMNDCKIFIFKVCLTQSADLSVFVLFFLFFYYSFLFFSTATCVLRFLHYFSTNLNEIWHVDSPWWDEQTEYFFKSIGPGVGIRRGPKVYYAL